MPLEQEVITMLIVGFSIVMGLVILATILIWSNKRTNSFAYGWTLLHLLLFSIAIYYLIKAISFDYNRPMASEEISLLVGLAGVMWAMSMLCFIIGIYNFSKRAN
ncbi:hypothetical protein [Bacillus solimangrovi]|uniref:Uncharacterized protein n=1 Tax=Bacillus solimangrovi TaxID=1305675 RepID=A0A1E5LK77_9BACI|nr:hypothetical protein [Bacillus solimangrovi]OEH94471.1 hypothetical protein BFG57_07280 [Bacillus solimangrovi]